MKHRIFLGILVLVLILLNALQTRVLDASPLLDTPSLLGTPFWQLKTALSAGLFTATSMMAAVGIGAFFWLGLLPACGARWTPEPALLRLGYCGAWCAWPVAASCIPALSYCVFPWVREEYLDGAFSGTALLMGQMTLSLIFLILLGYLLQGPARDRTRLPAVFVSALIALGCGLLWWWGKGLDFLVMALASSLSVIILLPHNPGIRPLLGSLLAVSAALCVYVMGFGGMMTAYAPTAQFSPALPGESGVTATICVIVLVLAGILLALLPVLRRRGKVLAGLPILLCGLLVVISIIMSGSPAPDTAAPDTGALVPRLTRWCAGLAAGLTLALSLVPAIRRSGLMLRLGAALALLLALCYAWLIMYANAATNGYEWPMGTPATVCYLLSLLLMLGLGWAYYRLKSCGKACREQKGNAGRTNTAHPQKKYGANGNL